MNNRTIYIDMDGVVADFNSYVSDFLGREIGWGISDLSSEEWEKVSYIDHFYLQLPLIEDSVAMVALCKSFSTRFNVEFLTALPRETTMPSAKQDKLDWINKYFPGFRVNFGPFSRDKQKWCLPNDILIDDKPSNVEEWAAKGGCAVYHTGKYHSTMQNILAAIDNPQPIIYC